MRKIPSFFLHAVALLMALLPLTAMADNEETALVRARIFNVPQGTADSLMSAPEFGTNVNGTLVKLAGLVKQHSAIVLANPSIQAPIGTNSVQVQGLVSMNLSLLSSPKVPLSILVEVTYAGQTLRTSSPVKRGQSMFLGSFDPPKSGGKTPAGTNLVFITVQ